ncbi:chitin-binding protein [Chitinimonas arctica]|uniref:Chitin-binding protein n=2 Tax=Chitinimonas arctica TaxID=2594795 RepID=A0A516SM18_9NEIS|nr:chitin-binding protein [Chitinimonas arctica]
MLAAACSGVAHAAQLPLQRAKLLLPPCDSWQSGQVYTAGQYVLHSNQAWRAKWWTRNEAPGGNAVWEARPAGECTPGNGGGEGGSVPTRAQVRADEQAKTASAVFQSVRASVRTLDNASVEAVRPGRSDNPANVRRVERILAATDWEVLFPQRHASYSYANFLQAIAKFPAVCGDQAGGRDADAICRKTLATQFAHFAQETGAHDPSSAIPQWRQGLYYLREAGCSEDGAACTYNAECAPGTWQGQTWPCGKQADGSWKKYFGRGAKQLSYNYNYGPFSDAMYGTVRTLLDNPERVADSWLNLASAVFFFVYPQPPKPSMLHIVDGSWQANAADRAAGISAGYGATIHIINGGIECGHGYDKPQALNRIAYYREMAAYLGVPIAAGEVLNCAGMQPFPAAGAGALQIYWEQDWSWGSNWPDGRSYACKLVGYQTPYSALKAGDYEKCVEKYFDIVLQ